MQKLGSKITVVCTSTIAQAVMQRRVLLGAAGYEHIRQLWYLRSLREAKISQMTYTN